ncbi:MAG: C39 family peptidase [Eggerthellaceae bacterium]|nr:C39 family peptidase [Eggerthellaceae bacterium]
MSMKRLAIPLCAVFSLLVIAGILEMYVVLVPSSTEAVAAEGASSATHTPVLSQVKTAIVFEQRAELARQNEASVSVRSLVEPGTIVVDGAPITQAQAEALVNAGDDFAANVRYIDQKAVLPSGCELVALAVAMNAEGVEVSPGDFVEHLRIGSNAATDYLGDPLRNGGGLPPTVVAAANAWASSRNVGTRAFDLTGTAFSGVLALAKLGYPVVAWTTEGLEKPLFDGAEQSGLQWYSPEHCVVIYGVDGDDVLVSDSLEGLVRRNLSQFASIYEACGNKAILVQP